MHKVPMKERSYNKVFVHLFQKVGRSYNKVFVHLFQKVGRSTTKVFAKLFSKSGAGSPRWRMATRWQVQTYRTSLKPCFVGIEIAKYFFSILREKKGSLSWVFHPHPTSLLQKGSGKIIKI